MGHPAAEARLHRRHVDAGKWDWLILTLFSPFFFIPLYGYLHGSAWLKRRGLRRKRDLCLEKVAGIAKKYNRTEKEIAGIVDEMFEAEESGEPREMWLERRKRERRDDFNNRVSELKKSVERADAKRT